MVNMKTRWNIVGCAAAIVTVAGLLAYGQESRVSGQSKSTLRKWWVSGVGGILEQTLQGKDIKFYWAGLYVATEPRDLVDKFTSDSWECTNCMALGPIEFWGQQELPDGKKVPQFRFGGADYDLQKLLKKAAFRLKGETNWVYLADFITAQSDGKHYYVSKCLRCGTVRKQKDEKCPFCGAAFPPVKTEGQQAP
jgi:hypothetical protein